MLNDLEAQVGARLCDRTTHTARLIPAGEAPLPTARRAMTEFDSATSDVKRLVSEAEPRFSLAAAPLIVSSVLPVRSPALRDTHPAVSVSISG